MGADQKWNQTAEGKARRERVVGGGRRSVSASAKLSGDEAQTHGGCRPDRASEQAGRRLCKASWWSFEARDDGGWM